MAKRIGDKRGEVELCPFLMGEHLEGDAYCRKGKCAWWSVKEVAGTKSTTEMCSMRRIASQLQKKSSDQFLHPEQAEYIKTDK